ncbi:MAG: bphP 1 [Proteobacteria bacterium]|nr:bphP 1 [Pseudomonadota bacterium]
MPGDTRILVLEDEALIAMDLEELLVARGFIVVGPFSTTADALASLDQTKLHAALLDVYLRRETSFDVGRELKRRGIPFAFTTGMADADLLPADLQGTPLILKPWAEKDVLAFLATEPVRGAPVAPNGDETHSR